MIFFLLIIKALKMLIWKLWENISNAIILEQNLETRKKTSLYKLSRESYFAR